MTGQRIQFPSGFLWGLATSSYQIEGAWNEDGRGESIWDRFSHTAGKITGADTGDKACDHYHRFGEDIELMRRLGVKSYRFSIAWPRVLPAGRGCVNEAGLDFYDRLVDALRKADIEPMVTLYHWDLPQALHEAGGWESRDVAGYFADYTAVMVRRLGDRVRYWATINEPWVIAFLGYRTGEHAPGVKDEKRALTVAHNLMVAHGLSMQALRDHKSKLEAGIVLSLWPQEPAEPTEKDAAIAEFAWQKELGWFLAPLLKGHYPDQVLEKYGTIAPQVKAGDMALIAQPMDLLGVNYYSRTLTGVKGEVSPVPGSQYTDMGWEVHAPALKRLLVRLASDYDCPPIYVTENGCAYKDVLGEDGQVHDPKRIEFLRDHLLACRQAIDEGVDLRGYYAWSLMDNFEWAHGFSKRFGLVYVNYKTQARTIKDSGKWYSGVIKSNSIEQIKSAELQHTL